MPPNCRNPRLLVAVPLRSDNDPSSQHEVYEVREQHQGSISTQCWFPLRGLGNLSPAPFLKTCRWEASTARSLPARSVGSGGNRCSLSAVQTGSWRRGVQSFCTRVGPVMKDISVNFCAPWMHTGTQQPSQGSGFWAQAPKARLI